MATRSILGMSWKNRVTSDEGGKEDELDNKGQRTYSDCTGLVM